MSSPHWQPSCTRLLALLEEEEGWHSLDGEALHQLRSACVGVSHHGQENRLLRVRLRELRERGLEHLAGATPAEVLHQRAAPLHLGLPQAHQVALQSTTTSLLPEPATRESNCSSEST